MYWAKVDFGTHKGKTLPEIILQDPDYFIWCIDKAIFNNHPELVDEADSLWRKMRSIKIPNNENNEMVVDYKIDNEKSEINRIILNGVDTQRDKNTVHRAGYLDLSFAHYYSNEKRNATIKVLPEIFKIVFGEMKIRPSIVEFEEFLLNEDNFGEN